MLCVEYEDIFVSWNCFMALSQKNRLVLSDRGSECDLGVRDMLRLIILSFQHITNLYYRLLFKRALNIFRNYHNNTIYMEPQNKSEQRQQPEAQPVSQILPSNQPIEGERPERAEAQGEADEDAENEDEEERMQNEENNQSNQNQQMEEEQRQKREGSPNQIPNQQQIQEGDKNKEDLNKNQAEAEQNEQQEAEQEEGEEGEQDMQEQESQKNDKPKVSEGEEKTPQPAQQQPNNQANQQQKPEEISNPPQAQNKHGFIEPAAHVQVHHEPQQQKPAKLSISLQSQRYINTLQTTLKNKESQLQTLSQTQSSLQARVSMLQAQNKQVKSAQLTKIQEILQLSKKQKSYIKEIENLKSSVQGLNEELKSYREVGDIKLMQRRIEQLQVLVQGQRQEISILTEQKQGIDDGMEERSQARMMPKEYITKMDELQKQKDMLEVKARQLQYQIGSKKTQSNEYAAILNQMDKEMKQKILRIAELQQNIVSERSINIAAVQNLQDKIKSLQAQLEKHQKVMAPEPQQQQVQEQANQNDTESKLLKVEEEKEIVFREFLKMELENKNLVESMKELKNKYQQSCKDLRNVKKQMVSKNDYDQILIRYKKCRSCLEKAIKENKMLRDHRGGENNGDVDQAEIEERNIGTGLLNEEESIMKKYMEIFNSHVQQSATYLKNTNSIIENIHFQKLAQEIKGKDKKIKQIEVKNERLEKLNDIFERELLYKNTILDRVVEELKVLRMEHSKMEQEKLNIQESLTVNISARSALKRLEVKSANLLIRNRKIQTEKESWKSLYEQLKQKYQQFVARDPYFNAQQSAQSSALASIEKQKYQSEEGEIEEEDNVRNRPAPQAKPITLSTQTQTQGLNQLYYKQIKETLSAFKKFPQMIKNTTANYQKIGKELEEYRKKYEQANEKYNLKHRALQTQKQANDNWREQAKRQIVNQFQDIRELVESDRLLVCLKKAKSLIEYLEQDEEAEEGQAK